MTNDKKSPDPVFDDELQGLEQEEESQEKSPLSIGQLWSKILHLGMGETVLRVTTAVVSIILVVFVVWIMSKFFLKAQKNSAAAAISPEETEVAPVLPTSDSAVVSLSSSFGIDRQILPHTNLPAKERTEVIEYEIQKGDTLFGIADKFALKPESLLWSNRHILGDDPHNIYPGVTILIPPFDGAIYQWHLGDGLNGVSSFYHVTPQDIINWKDNNLDLATLGDLSLPNIAPGTLLFVPHGYGEFTSWIPTFTRETAAEATVLGPGHCDSIYEGPVGNETFVWPTTETYLSGYDYSPSTNHRGIDIAGKIGNPIYAVDAGVVVYSGWNNNGYGNLIIVDHGNGWQSVYAHLDTMAVGCAAYVYQGDTIGTLGTTGNSSGPHLHFELRNAEYGIVNPWDFLTK